MYSFFFAALVVIFWHYIMKCTRPFNDSNDNPIGLHAMY